VDNWSFGLDLKILLATVQQVLQSTGISYAGHATTIEFQGSDSTER
jgi:hypothetical protein